MSEEPARNYTTGRQPPGYWEHEISGVLRPAVEAYLTGGDMSQEHVAAMRAYLRQWIASPAWRGLRVVHLRRDIDFLVTREAIARWLYTAGAEGIDPL